MKKNSRHRTSAVRGVKTVSGRAGSDLMLDCHRTSDLSLMSAAELVDGLARELRLVERFERSKHAGAIALWNQVLQQREQLNQEDSRKAA